MTAEFGFYSAPCPWYFFGCGKIESVVFMGIHVSLKCFLVVYIALGGLKLHWGIVFKV